VDGRRDDPRQGGNDAEGDRNGRDPVARETAEPIVQVQADLWGIADGRAKGHVQGAAALELHAAAMALAGMPGMCHELAGALAGLHAAEAARLTRRSQPEGE